MLSMILNRLSYRVCKIVIHFIECMHITYVHTTVIERPPKIVNKPHNITTDIGLPVTLTCYVEGDPNHYWVGWMSRQTIIHAGEKHSISTSPNFKSTNGTTHHLTIHSVKEAGKYECKVYTMTGDVQDQLTHHVFAITNGNKRCMSSYQLVTHIVLLILQIAQ